MTLSGHAVVRSGPRPDPAAIDGLAALGVATVHEAMGRTGLVGSAVLARQDDVTIAGAAVTVSCHPGDNLMLHAAVEQCREGDVLVVTSTSPSTVGQFGDLLATSLQSRGVRGVVTDAGVRDLATLRRMRFPVWSRAVSAQGAVKVSAGSVNVPVVCAGQLVRAGDLVVADDDGVVVVPLGEETDVLRLARSRAETEIEKRRVFASGVLGLDLYNLRPLLQQLGVRYVDSGVEPGDHR